MHAEKCPICGGAGQLQGINDLSGSAANPPTRTCHGCGGKGWVEVSNGPYYTIQPTIDAPSIQPYQYPWYYTTGDPTEPQTTC